VTKIEEVWKRETKAFVKWINASDPSALGPLADLVARGWLPATVLPDGEGVREAVERVRKWKRENERA
jgi:hypothetical protein